MTSTAPIRTTIERAGQPYVDEPVYANPTAEGVIAASVRRAFGRPPARKILLAYQMTKLNWVKPRQKSK